MRLSTAWVMAAACGLVVANNYYNQPLLVDFAASFHVSEKTAGGVAALTQLGYALGMLALLPLGDMLERRRLVTVMLLLACVSLVATALSPSIACLMVAGFALGFTSIVPQLLTPFAAQLAEPQERGRIVGIVMGGLLAGILLSRTIAGFVGKHWGWPTMYWLASGIMVVLVFVLAYFLPKGKPSYAGSYAELMRSLPDLIRKQPVLRETSLVAACQFAAFSAFWTTLTFQVHRMPGHYGSDVAGMFGIFGVVGACAAPYAGKLADRKNPRLTVMLSSAAMLAGYCVFALFGSSLAGLAAGVILLDLGMQSGHVSNMTRNFSLKGDAMSRVNTVYMVTRFLGGAAGSVAGNLAWERWQWTGVCGAGLALCLCAVAVQLYYGRQPAPAFKVVK
jgi:predicted MFS family arabinose efflux permease